MLYTRAMKLLQKYFLVVISAFLMVLTIFHVRYGKIIEERKNYKYKMILIPSGIKYYQPALNDLACYESINNDSLQSVEDPNFSPQSKSIFFHETSCRGGIDSRQACAVESAARANPDWDVYLLFNAPVTEVMLKKSCLVKLLEYPNVRVARIHASSFSANTAVYPVVTQGLWQSKHPLLHSADIMKMLTLNRWGGMYLDLDVLVLKSFNSLPRNWIAKETLNELSTGVMSLWNDEVGQNVTAEVLTDISNTYNPESWSDTGHLAIQRVLFRRCHYLAMDQGDCYGLSIFGHEYFYPIRHKEIFKLFKNRTLNVNLTDPYTYHMWDLLTNIYPVHINSTYARIARIYCPNIYEMYGKSFGD